MTAAAIKDPTTRVKTKKRDRMLPQLSALHTIFPPTVDHAADAARVAEAGDGRNDWRSPVHGYEFLRKP